MEMKVQIPFEQLLAAVKDLTPSQKGRLREELDGKKADKKGDNAAFIEMMINGPVLTEEEINSMKETRKSVSKWHAKK